MCSFLDLVSCQENYPTKHSREVQDKLKASHPTTIWRLQLRLIFCNNFNTLTHNRDPMLCFEGPQGHSVI